MDNKFIRTEMLLGKEALEKLKNSKVMIFGIGGVGSFVAEAIARCAVGEIILVDSDVISISNINRQIHANCKSVGKYKVEEMRSRILDINPDAKVKCYTNFFLPGEESIIDKDCDYIIDAIDTVSGKLGIIVEAKRLSIPVISSMGTGNKLNPTMLEVSDIYKTSVCPLAKVMRKELKTRGIDKLKVVYSKEIPKKCAYTEDELKELGENTNKRRTPGSISFVPSVAGLIIASEVVKDLTEVRNG